MNRRLFLRAGAASTAMLGAATGLPAAQGKPPAAGPDEPLRVHFLLFGGVDALDYLAPHEVLHHAREAGAMVDTRLVSQSGPRQVTTSSGVRFDVDAGWSPQDADVIVVPGGGYGRGPQTAGVDAEIHRGDIPALLTAARRPGLTFASVCTGAMLLSAAGITKDRPCTTHHFAIADLEKQGGRVTDARVVDDGDLITAGGVTSGLDLGLWLVERTFGANTAHQVQSVLEYERRGTVWTAS